MKNSVLCLIGILLMAGCGMGGNKRETVITEPDSILQVMIAEHAGIAIQEDSLTVNMDSISKVQFNASYTGLIYMLNSDCSFCLGKFFDFLVFLRSKKFKGDVMVVVGDGGEQPIKYQMKQVGLDGWGSLVFLNDCNRNIVNQSLEECNGMTLSIISNKINKKVLFVRDGE